MEVLKSIGEGILAVLITLYAVYFIKTWRMRRLMRNVPNISFFSIPWLSCIYISFQRKKTRNYELYRRIEQFLAAYPKICYSFLFHYCMVDVRDADYIRTILTSEKCIDRADFYFFPYKTGLLASSGEIWKKHRKMLNPAFSTKKILQFLPAINEKARVLVEVLDANVDQPPFNIVRYFSALTVDSLMKTSFGLDKNFLLNPYDKFFELVKHEAASIGESITNIYNMFVPAVRNEGKFVTFAKEILIEAEERLKDEYDDGKLMNFIKILLNNRQNLTEVEIQDEVATMIMAGNASTALTMATCVVMLGIHQDVQENANNELKSIFQNKNQEVDAESLQKMVYLEMVIKEAMRLFPIAAITGRKVTSDLQLDDNMILPAGTNVFIRTIDVQRNPRYWGADADRFKPERFLPQNMEKIHPYAYIPFSASHRICIGHKYTMNVMKITLSHFLRNYRITTDLKYDDIKLEISFILRIAQNYMIKIYKRNF